jgi:hypothetical protein
VAGRAGHATLLSQHLHRLPLTAAYIETAEESREEYAHRKLAWVEAHYRREGRAPAPWEVVRRAALRPDLAAALASDVDAIVRRLDQASLGIDHAA